MHQCHADAADKTIVGSDGSYKVKGQGVSTFVIKHNDTIIHSSSRLVLAHSSYNMEMHAANQAIEYIAHNLEGSIIFFIDNQSTLKLIFNTKSHLAFELSQNNCQYIGDWLGQSQNNSIEFRWMPSHLGFDINEHADLLADVPIIGPAPFPVHNIASRIRYNCALVVNEWRTTWAAFAERKDLKLKKKRKPMVPHAWDIKANSSRGYHHL